MVDWGYTPYDYNRKLNKQFFEINKMFDRSSCNGKALNLIYFVIDGAI